MKTNIYDWPDEYDQIATSMIQFLMEHALLKSMFDLGFPMEVHRTRLVGKDFSKTYDFTKTYDVSDYVSLKGVSNAMLHMAIKENYMKMQDASLRSWLCKGTDNYSDDSELGREHEQ